MSLKEFLSRTLICLDIPATEERKRDAYRQKITECIDRAEKLKDLVNQEKGTV